MKKILLLIVTFYLCFFSTVKAEGIIKDWEKNIETTTWLHLDLFDYSKSMADYKYHLRGFKELDDSYIMNLKGGDGLDEIVKISKSGELIKKITFTPRNSTTSNYRIYDNYILAGYITTNSKAFIFKIEKYDLNLEKIEEKEIESGTTFNIKRIFFNEDNIQLATVANNQLTIEKFDFSYNKISTNETSLEGYTLNSMFNDTTITIGGDTKSIVYDSQKEKISTNDTVDYQTHYYQYVEQTYPDFYGDNKHIGTNFYYLKHNDTYDVYTHDGKFITTDTNRYFYDLHGKLAVAKDFQNNSFNIYNNKGELEMDCNMFVIISDGFLVLTKQTDEEGTVVSTKIEKYKIQYNVTKDVTENGSIIVEEGTHNVNDKIKIELNPNEGYVLDKLIIIDSNGNQVSYDENYTFIMPGSDITIKATYKKQITEETKSEETKKEEEPNPDTGWYNIIKEFIILIGLSLLIVSIMKKYYKIQKL